MELLAIHTDLLRAGDDLSMMVQKSADLQRGDIIVISSKVVAMTEGAAIDLRTLEPNHEAQRWSALSNRSPAFHQAVLDETERMYGSVIGSCPQALLCELRPDGLGQGTILAVNAGLDLSNIDEGWAIGWPRDPLSSVRKIRDALSTKEKRIAIILSDSCCRPRRRGVTALALTVSGIDPLQSQIGKKDLFGHPLVMTHEAVADQLATAAGMIMGNADQGIPAVIIRDHGIPFTSFTGWVPGIEPEEDLFRDLFTKK